MEAALYEKLEGGRVHCFLCSHHCRISPGSRGRCGVRENRDGILFSLVYQRAVAAGSDPIEKKPLFHFLPGSDSFSLAAAGCNFTCFHCQNWAISQVPRGESPIPGRDLPPEEVVSLARRTGCRSISYTYTEPTIFFEYARDTAVRARERGLKNIFVTNGFMTAQALEAAADWLDAANVDLKSFREDFYRRVCSASLKPVLESITGMVERGIWIEVTTLVIPGYNDSEPELKEIAGFLSALNAEIPWHVSAFHPDFKMNATPRTPAETLRTARGIGRAAGLKYVYTGNLPGDEGENTFCPVCRNKVVGRSGFTLLDFNLRRGHCRRCGEKIAGVWE